MCIKKTVQKLVKPRKLVLDTSAGIYSVTRNASFSRNIESL